MLEISSFSFESSWDVKLYRNSWKFMPSDLDLRLIISFCLLSMANINILLALKVTDLTFRAYFPYFLARFAMHGIALHVSQEVLSSRITITCPDILKIWIARHFVMKFQLKLHTVNNATMPLILVVFVLQFIGELRFPQSELVEWPEYSSQK